MSDWFTEEEIEIAESALHSEKYEEPEEIEEETWEEFFNKRKQNGLV